MPSSPPQTPTKPKRSWFGVSFIERLFFVQNLTIMLKAGLPLADALQSLTRQVNHKNTHNMIVNVTQYVERGSSLEEALRATPQLLPSLAVTLIGAGEKSGNLDIVFQRLTAQMKRDHDMRNRVRNALSYPVIVIILMCLIALFVFLFVLPQLTSLFNEFQTELPLPTRILMNMGVLAEEHGIVIVIMFIATIIMLGIFCKTPRGKRTLSWLALRLPIAKTISHNMNIACMARTLALLIRTDLPLLESLQLTAATLRNLYYRDALMAAQKSIQQGILLSEALAPYQKIIPVTMIEMISVGERSGALDDVLDEIAEFYEEEASATFENLPTLIEPILIVILGLAVGGLAVAVMLPIFKLSQNI